jgi:[protein-PII] uridylyltransferase
MEQIVSHLSNQRRKLKEIEQLEDPGRISAMVDVAIISLYNRLTNRSDLHSLEIRRHGTVLAIGEYGRRQLGPFSPITLLFLQGSEAPFEEDVWNTGIVQPLEEAGWEVQSEAIKVDDAVEQCLGDFSWLTSLLDSRFISGSRQLMDDLRLSLIQEIESNKDRQSIRAFLEDWQERKDGQLDPSFILEPDLEYSSGGLGELNRIRWAGYLLNGVERGFETNNLDSASYSALQKAELFFLRVRNHLQLFKRGQETQLQYEAQREVAHSLGYEDQGDFLAVEMMMKELEGHFYEIGLVASRFMELLRAWIASGVEEKVQHHREEVAPGMWVERGLLMMDSDQLDNEEKGLLELCRQAVQLDVDLSGEAYQWAKGQAGQLPGGLEGQAELRDWLFEIIRKENSGIKTIRALYETEVLPNLIPELRQVHALVQHDAFHLYPVHEHHLRTFAELKKLLNGEYSSAFPQIAEWLEGIGNQEVLLLAGLIHDVGKSGGHGHARRGGDMSLLIAERLGLADEEKQLLSFLVLNHVLLTDSAARRDIDDEKMLQNCAGEIRSVELLKMLLLHSFADLRATGPQAWEFWQNLPMLELYQCLLHRLERGDPDVRAVAARLLSLKRQVAELLGDEMTKEELNYHFEQLPSRYLLSATPEEVVNQYRLERQLEKEVLAWRLEERQGMWELTLMSRQPLGLLARAAGILTLNQLDIRKARTHTKKNGVAFQTFEVTALDPGKEISWEKVMDDLKKTLQGRLALDYRLALHAADQRRKRRRAPAKPDEVVVDNYSSDQYTIIEVYTTDRPGLLYAITRAMLDLQLKVYLAKISTRIDQVADIFYVLTREGERVEDSEHAEEIRQALLFSLQ